VGLVLNSSEEAHKVEKASGQKFLNVFRRVVTEFSLPDPSGAAPVVTLAAVPAAAAAADVMQ
jgi:hypothetical protein